MLLSPASFAIAALFLNLSALPTMNAAKPNPPSVDETVSYNLDYSQTSFGATASGSESYSSQDTLIAGAPAPQFQESTNYATCSQLDQENSIPPAGANDHWTLY
jgi:hypothetical protein